MIDIPYRIYHEDYYEGDALIDIFGQTYCFQLGGDNCTKTDLESALKDLNKQGVVPRFKIRVSKPTRE